MRRLAPLLLLTLAACETPQDACLRGASRERGIVEGLIAETQGNLRRGYALEEEQVVRTVRDFCEVEDDEGRERRTFCDRTEVRDVSRPVAIDPAAEQAKLDGLLERRARIAAEQTDRLLACQALPDSEALSAPGGGAPRPGRRPARRPWPPWDGPRGSA